MGITSGGNEERGKRRRLPALLAVSIVILLPLVTALMLLHSPTISYPDASGYVLEDPSIDTRLNDLSSEVSITHQGMVRFTRTPEGLVCTMRWEGDAIILHLDAVNSVALSLNVSDLVRYQGNQATVGLIFYDDAQMVSIIYGIGMHSTSVTYFLDDGSSTETVYSDLLLDRPDDADLLAIINEKGIRSGLNGIEEFRSFEQLAEFEPQRMEVRVEAGNGINSLRDVTVFRMQASQGDGYRYIDSLHKTIVPDGKDMAFSLHIHADKAFIQHFGVMANLSYEYGLKGTYDAWWKGNAQQYGMESPEYVAALHALQDSGWDIGIHAGSSNDLTREQVIFAMENITAEFGPIRTWSDHGLRPQSLVVDGANEGSPNYVKDLVIDIGAGWWHENTHAHSRWNDLNRDGMNYTLPGQEEVPLFRVSKQQALQLFFETGRQQDVSSWLRSMPVQRSVFVAHDYFPFFFQVENDTGNYSVLPSHGDVQNTPWSAIRPKSDFVNGTWSALPSFVAMLDLLSSYDVWYAPVRDVYDRSCLVQNVMLQETGTQVILTNLNQVEVKGLTLFTRGQPNYLLFDGITPLSVQQGSAGSWHFVIDLEPGEVLVLDKLSAEARPLSVTSYVDTPYMAVRETWPGAL